MKSITMSLTEGRSDKIYATWIESTEGGFAVKAQFGRRGARMIPRHVTGPVSLEAADRAWQKLVAEKNAKGYRPFPSGEDVAPPQSAPMPAPAETAAFVTPMLLNEIDSREADRLIENSAWVMQPKIDGIRCQLHRIGKAITAYSRTAKPVEIPAALAAAFLQIAPGAQSLSLDGELVGAEFFAFDLLDLDGPSIRDLELSARLDLLDRLAWTNATCLQRVPTAYTLAEKQAMYAVLKASGAEGAVFKDIDYRYQYGRPNSGGHGLKRKFVATASVIVAAHNSRRSIEIMLDDWTPLGSVPIPTNKAIPELGAVIEVRYLYAHRGGSLSQAVFLMVRNDIPPTACTIDQLQFKAEARS